MAKSDSLLLLSGTIAGLSFYKSGGVTIVRRPWGPDKKRISKDPNYVRTRENNEEFGNCIKASTLLRKGTAAFAKGQPYKRLSPRLNQLMLQLKKLDNTSVRGKRLPGKGLKTAEGKQLLQSFAFNAEVPLESILNVPLQADVKKGTLSLNKLLAKRDLKFPKSATHVRLSAGMLLLNLEELTVRISKAPEVMLSKKEGSQNLILKIPSLPKGKGFRLFVLSIDFFQEVNQDLRSVANAEGSCCSIVCVL